MAWVGDEGDKVSAIAACAIFFAEKPTSSAHTKAFLAGEPVQVSLVERNAGTA